MLFLQIDHVAINMDRALEGATIDTPTFQHRPKVLEEKMNRLLISGAVILGLTGLVWFGNRFKEKKNRGRKRKRKRELNVGERGQQFSYSERLSHFAHSKC